MLHFMWASVRCKGLVTLDCESEACQQEETKLGIERAQGRRAITTAADGIWVGVVVCMNSMSRGPLPVES